MGGSSPLDEAGRTGKVFQGAPLRLENEVLLESVLRRTWLRDVTEEGFPENKEQATLRQVASRHCGRSLAEPPVLVELIAAALEHQFPPAANNSEFLRSLSQPIAETLREDPFAWNQLELLWARLCEVVL